MHEQCTTHKRAVEAVIILPATTNFKDVGELLSSVHASEKNYKQAVFVHDSGMYTYC